MDIDQINNDRKLPETLEEKTLAFCRGEFIPVGKDEELINNVITANRYLAKHLTIELAVKHLAMDTKLHINTWYRYLTIAQDVFGSISGIKKDALRSYLHGQYVELLNGLKEDLEQKLISTSNRIKIKEQIAKTLQKIHFNAKLNEAEILKFDPSIINLPGISFATDPAVLPVQSSLNIDDIEHEEYE